MNDGEAAEFLCLTTSTWELISDVKDDKITRVRLIGTASTNQRFSSNPQVAVSANISLGYTVAKITVSATVSSSKDNRGVVFGLYIDGVLRGDLVEAYHANKETSVPYTFVLESETIFSGTHLVEIRYGIEGAGNSVATLKNPKALFEVKR